MCVFLSRTPVTWLLDNSSALPWHQVTSDGSLVLQQVELSAQGDYSCWDSRGLLLHTVRLRLGRECPPLQFLCLVLGTPGLLVLRGSSSYQPAH